MLTTEEVEQAFLSACRLDVEAFKPGNVSIASPGHRMNAEDFLKSAEVAAPIMARPPLGVGERILLATQATWAAVGCNTNLGILLLCAPLAQAAMHLQGALSQSVADALSALNQRDAELAFEAIRIASPAGLGQAAEHDVRDPPRVTLLAAMQAAAERDSIARQYATNFKDVFELGLSAARESLAKGRPSPWVMTRIFIAFLSSFPDSHIARKFGLPTAQLVQDEARHYADVLSAARDPTALLGEFQGWDQRLKARGLNPGTSADLSAATWFALTLEELLNKR